MNSVILNNRSLEKLLSIAAKTAPTPIALPSRKGMARSTALGARDGEPPGGHEDVHQNDVEDQLLHGRSPLQKGEQRPRVLEGAGLVDHPELQAAGMGFDGDATGVVEHHQKEREGSEDGAGGPPG